MAAPAGHVWPLISDLPRMGDLSPENTGGSWLGGATGPAVGARFRGANRRGWRRWSTSVQVTTCEPDRAFGFDVRSLGLPVASWAYELTPTGPGSCRVTESWTDSRGRLMQALGGLATGITDRATHTGRSIEHTLGRLKERVESG